MSALSEALDQLRRGGMIVLVDNEDRENEGDLVVAAQFATPDAVNFMATHGRGLVCLALDAQQADRLDLAPMVPNNKARRSTAFTVSIEARDGITTGISAHDRAQTIKAAINPDVKRGEIVSPGHIFPLRAAAGGVLKRNGHTEGATDLMRLAGLSPAGVICEVMNADGTMARRAQLDVFAAQHNLPVLTIQEIVDHRMTTEKLVEEVAAAELPTGFADDVLRVHAFRSLVDGTEHLAIVKHPLGDNPLVRVHSECLTGDALGSLRCDCGMQLQEAIRLVSHSDGGAVIYVRGHEGRGIGLVNKIRAYALQDRGRDTVQANTDLGFPDDARGYAMAVQIIKQLGIKSLTLLSNNPRKSAALEHHGIRVNKRQPLEIASNPFNAGYLASKRDKLGHLFTHQQG
jgi:3,4-dihydroxy 2-butanone 4-phosphate synthase / GTP cyclohydrolase II